jgi:fructosamine-3-kinase
MLMGVSLISKRLSIGSHGGQWSNLYAALSQSPYTPSPLAHGVEHEGDMAVELYEMLENEFIVPAYTVG